ncbi:MAG: hypothetical protein KC910_23920 [Candidatus Eremiobacteraeota bacterium]|nr:hypothetical protein [Candidatus Eremiobacteraeota bacterium]
MRIQPISAASLRAPLTTAAGREPAQPQDGYAGTVAVTQVQLPPLEQTTPQQLQRGYLWQAIPLPGPVDKLLGAVLGFGPVPGWMGLEPAPQAPPQVQPLGFSWTGCSASQFADRAEQLRAALQNGREAGKARIRAGSNANYLVSLDNGVAAVFTPSKGERPPGPARPNLEAGRLAQREEAAYLVDRRLGHLARVPPVVAGGLDGRPGALKLFVPRVPPEDPDHALTRMNPSDYRRLALFDHIIGNLDRHSRNWLVDEGRPIAIDHGLAFPLKNGPQGPMNFAFDKVFRINAEERKLLTDFVAARGEVEQELSKLLAAPAIDAMFERVAAILSSGEVNHQWHQ